ncbi:hypothetical protein [Achromobacter deleyi]|uniref:hypothetical protein n=1 Tax=Achromobacter deleyi TaxID=1353891 RepID=UPI0014689DA4|nr:hypothetical protein [Achromobacter deleyi]CAB3884490.1 hypothetical protein LMG3412_03431 [Achromobacter deleyi]
MLNRKTAARLLLALMLTTGAAGAWAQSAAASSDQVVSSQVILGGQAKFVAPPGYIKVRAKETDSMVQTSYQNAATKHGFVTTDGVAQADLAGAAFRTMIDTYEAKQRRAMQSYSEMGSKNLKIAGFDGAQRDVQGTVEGKFGGKAILRTTTFVASGDRYFFVVTISPADDAANHQDFATTLQRGISAAR